MSKRIHVEKLPNTVKGGVWWYVSTPDIGGPIHCMPGKKWALKWASLLSQGTPVINHIYVGWVSHSDYLSMQQAITSDPQRVTFIPEPEKHPTLK